jgi:hypothetical protein
MTTTTQQPTITLKRTLNPDDRVLVVSPADYACRCGSVLSERIAYVGNGVCRCESCGASYDVAPNPGETVTLHWYGNAIPLTAPVVAVSERDIKVRLPGCIQTIAWADVRRCETVTPWLGR